MRRDARTAAWSQASVRAATAVRHHAGPVAWAGMAALLAAVLLAGAVAPLLQARSDARQARAAAARPAVPAMPPAQEPTPAQALWSSLPGQAQLNADVATLVDEAAQAGVALERAELQPIAGNAPLVRVDVQLQFAAPYERLRPFLARVLNRLPHASMRTLRLERMGGAAPGAEAALAAAPVQAAATLRLHYRGQP